MLATHPEISVIMSVYNGGSFLKQAIESILNQEFQNFDFIIVNDGSDDDTSKILDEYSKIDERIKVINNEEKRGLTFSLGLAIAKSNAPFFARMDADDLSLPDRLGKQLDFVKNNPEVAVVSSNAIVIDGNGREVKKVTLPPDNLFVRLLPRRNLFVHGSTMIRRASFDIIGGYNKKFLLAQDYDLFLRFLKNGYKLANLSDYLYELRSNPGSLSVKRVWRQAYFTALSQNNYFSKDAQGVGGKVSLLWRFCYCWFFIYKLGIPALLRLLKIIK